MRRPRRRSERSTRDSQRLGPGVERDDAVAGYTEGRTRSDHLPRSATLDSVRIGANCLHAERNTSSHENHGGFPVSGDKPSATSSGVTANARGLEERLDEGLLAGAVRTGDDKEEPLVGADASAQRQPRRSGIRHQRSRERVARAGMKRRFTGRPSVRVPSRSRRSASPEPAASLW